MKVIEFGPTVRGRSLLVFGQSGDPASPHFLHQAQLDSDREFKPAWFTREEVEANAVEAYTPGEAVRPDSTPNGRVARHQPAYWTAECHRRISVTQAAVWT